ncbi:MAG: acetyltransferase [Labilithrix sp.]|nr:acetyltransferase [Labilithrix sp.]
MMRSLITPGVTRTLAARIPDVPRWVEARDYLLSGECEVFGLEDTPEPALVVRDPSTGFLVVVGAPAPEAIAAAVADVPPGASLVSAPEHARHVAQALPRDWVQTRAILHVLRHPERLPTSEADVTFLDLTRLEAQRDLTDELRRELEAALASGPVAAALENALPVAFCYPSAVTESLWDVSIDTLAAHRRRGHAGRAAAHMVRHMSSSGRSPVWAALEENAASFHLAQKLGFEAVDELAFFEP